MVFNRKVHLTTLDHEYDDYLFPRVNSSPVRIAEPESDPHPTIPHPRRFSLLDRDAADHRCLLGRDQGLGRRFKER